MREKLKKKSICLLLTNNCLNNCSNCEQHCDIFKQNKDEIWNIPLNQFKDNLDVIFHDCRSEWNGSVGLFGGEPTTHPHFPEVLELVASYPNRKFILFTSVNKNFILPANVRKIFGDIQKKWHYPIMVAPLDVKPSNNYWEDAQKYCPAWLLCGSIIYDNKAFICTTGASIERLKLGKEKWHQSCGWDLKIGVDPFDRSSSEIETQANSFCHRCHQCLEKKMKEELWSPTKFSQSNSDLIRWNCNNVEFVSSPKIWREIHQSVHPLL
jgi:hypothetical protein